MQLFRFWVLYFDADFAAAIENNLISSPLQQVPMAYLFGEA